MVMKLAICPYCKSSLGTYRTDVSNTTKHVACKKCKKSLKICITNGELKTTK